MFLMHDIMTALVLIFFFTGFLIIFQVIDFNLYISNIDR
jgi:hypothetical protein